MSRISVITSIALLSLLSGAVRARQPAAEASPQTVIRTYNVGDLIEAPPAPAVFAAPMSANAARMIEVPINADPALPGRVMEVRGDAGRLRNLLIELVDSDSWRENGGAEGQIKEFGALLIIEQTPQNHERIADVLGQIRREQGPRQLIQVRAHWVHLEPSEIAKITDPEQTGGVLLSDVDAYLAERSYCLAQTSGFSGQPMQLVSVREQTYVQDVTPIVADNAIGYDPRPEVVPSGVTLNIVARAPQDDQIVISLSGTVTEVASTGVAADGATTRPAASAAMLSMIDRLNVLKHEMQTTLRVPLNRKVLIGGMTLDPAAREQPARELYLVIEVIAAS